MASINSSYERSHSIGENHELITYIIPDFKAVSYFEKEFSARNEFHIVEESTSSGFDIYLVEQWLSNRKIGTVISMFTGNQDQKVSVVKFTILKKQTRMYPLRFQEYLNEQILNQATLKKMDIGSQHEDSSTIHNHVDNQVLFVTNITTLPSDLNLIPLPNGDSRIVEENFLLNYNLKKLQCSGRSLSLISDKISDASEDKFRQMYNIYTPHIPIRFAIQELINIIQMGLFYFDLLDAKYCDGLLCSKTEEAIMNWWNFIGLPHFNFKASPKNGILPSSTVAAIIGLILSVKIRLQLVGGCDVPKDPFDFENFMISIGQFQKQYKLEKRRKLDLETLNKLFSVTNAKILHDPNKVYHHNEPYDETYDSNFTNSKVLSLSLNNLYPSLSNVTPMSTSKRNKNYYSKELKKFTNVVKSTVQDRINMTNEDDPTNSKSTLRIRNRLAKLTDNVSPLDVEILDLETLVKHYFVGKTLVRLWYGMGPTSTDPKLINGKGQRNRQRIQNNKQYEFVSFKDKISKNQNMPNLEEFSLYSKGLNKMKAGLQSTGLLSSTPNLSKRDVSILGKDSEKGDNGAYLGDPFIGEGRKKSFDNMYCNNAPSICNDINNELMKINGGLNRRNSFPTTKQEDNLNLMEYKRNERLLNLDELNNISRKHRSLSFSYLEDYILRSDQKLYTAESISSTHLKTVENLIQFNYLKKVFNDDIPASTSQTNQHLASAYNQLNFELMKFTNIYNQTMANKYKIIDQDLSDKLEYDINELTATTDRLTYEKRIVSKRLNELDENSKILELKLHDQCEKKLASIIEHLVHLKKFNKVFSDIKERDEIVFKLTGKDSKKLNLEKTNTQTDGITQIFKLIIVFIYDIIILVFLYFKFDKRNMNLDRIMQTWRKVDPNKNIMNKAYKWIDRDPTKDMLSGLQEK